MKQERDEFSVFVFFVSGDYMPDVRFVSAQRAVERAKALTESVGARIGAIRRIIITDGGDYTVFEWRHGLGVTYPPQGGTTA